MMLRIRRRLRRLKRRLGSRKAEKITSRLPGLCKFLRSRDEVDLCTAFLQKEGFVAHALECKNWDVAHVVPEIDSGDVLDMGSCESYVLKNLALGGHRGALVGIDLRQPDVPHPRVQHIVGDLMETGLPSQAFRHVACLSVIEHEVEFDRFAAETSRLLEPGGRAYVTFDYWEPEVVTPPEGLYGLAWQPLDAAALRRFLGVCEDRGLRPIEPMDWSLGDPVIRDGYFSPYPETSYTFGLVVLVKGGADAPGDRS